MTGHGKRKTQHHNVCRVLTAVTQGSIWPNSTDQGAETIESVPDAPRLDTQNIHRETSSNAFAGKKQLCSGQKSIIRPSSHSDNASSLSVSVSVTSPFVPSTSVSRSPCRRFLSMVAVSVTTYHGLTRRRFDSMVAVTTSCLTTSRW